MIRQAKAARSAVRRWGRARRVAARVVRRFAAWRAGVARRAGIARRAAVESRVGAGRGRAGTETVRSRALPEPAYDGLGMLPVSPHPMGLYRVNGLSRQRVMRTTGRPSSS